MTDRLPSFYYSEARSEDWVKFKTQESIETIICGYTKSESSPFGLLILGLRKKDELVYVGNCGTGFSIALQKELISQFVKIKQPKSSFAEKINLNGREPVWLHPIKMTSQFLRLWIGLKSIRTFLKKCSVMKSV